MRPIGPVVTNIAIFYQIMRLLKLGTSEFVAVPAMLVNPNVLHRGPYFLTPSHRRGWHGWIVLPI